MIYLSGKHDMRFQHQAHAGVMTTPNDWWPQDWLLGFRWAADTGSYTNPEGYSTTKYLQWLTRKKPFQAMCLFATAPDVVGEPVATWDKAEPVLPQIRALGYPAALVAQDGVEECPIDWTAFDAWFVGGTTKWKLSSPSYALMAEARARGSMCIWAGSIPGVVSARQRWPGVTASMGHMRPMRRTCMCPTSCRGWRRCSTRPR